jgi:glycerophosphoryl diester phosphodiesterase
MRYLVALVVLLHAPAALADPVCVAHRGNAGDHLENSRAALESAIELGAKAVELDVRHTRDGAGIVMHDATLRRTARSHESKRCPLNTPIKELTSAEILSKCRLRNGERVPLLEGFLETTSRAGVVVFLELKGGRPSAATVALLERHFTAAPQNLRLISYNASTLEWARSRLASLVEGGARVYHIADKPGRLDWGFDGVCVRRPTRGVVRSIIRGGKHVGVFVVDRVRGMKRYADLGVDYVVTNRIAACLDAL